MSVLHDVLLIPKSVSPIGYHWSRSAGERTIIESLLVVIMHLLLMNLNVMGLIKRGRMCLKQMNIAQIVWDFSIRREFSWPILLWVTFVVYSSVDNLLIALHSLKKWMPFVWNIQTWGCNSSCFLIFSLSPVNSGLLC